MINPNIERMRKIKEQENNPEWHKKVNNMTKKDKELEDVKEEEMPEAPQMTKDAGPDGDGIPIGFEPKAEGQVTLDGEKPVYTIDYDVSTTVTHKFESAIAKLSISEKALEKWTKDGGRVLGLVKTKITPAPSVEGEQWEALCEEFAEAVELEMM